MSVLVAVVGLVLPALPLRADSIKIEIDASGRRVFTNSGKSRAPTYRRAARVRTPLPAVELDPLIQRYSGMRDLDPKLVAAVIRAESANDPRAVSSKGAMGLMQLMPGTANDLNVSDAFDPEENVRGGTLYLRRQLDRFDGSLELALAAYNAGPEAVARFGGIPPYSETQGYVEKILRDYHGDPLYEAEAATVAAVPQVAGRKVFLSRDASGKVVMSTFPGGR